MHFWCDAYGLDNFFEQFDVFGELAPAELNNTWLLKHDGLYRVKGKENKRFSTWWKGGNSSLAATPRLAEMNEGVHVQISASNVFL
uniref:Fibrinogen C-terminal domain-containing protein n=1 Tax=Steinernema glaseri TaxID=37863 RepID=A0A1I7YGV7_9BILA